MPLGFAFQGVASKLCFRDRSQLKWRFWWMGVCSERVEIMPVPLGLALGESCFGVLDVAVPLGLALGESCFWGVGCGRAIGICVSGCGIEALFS